MKSFITMGFKVFKRIIINYFAKHFHEKSIEITKKYTYVHMHHAET